jgi:hypothetical protein
MQLSQVAALDGQIHLSTRLNKSITDVGVTLYLITDHKQSLPEFTQLYAGYISAEAVSELSYDTNGQSLLLDSTGGEPQEDQRYVLTKLYRTFPVAEMTYDLYPREEENTGLLNEEGEIENRVQAVWLIAGVSVVAIFVLIGAIIMMNKRTNILKN